MSPNCVKEELKSIIKSISNLTKTLTPCSTHLTEIGLDALVAASGLVDDDFYLSTYEDVAKAGINPSVHYTTWGYKENRIFSRLLIPYKEKIQYNGGSLNEFLCAILPALKKELDDMDKAQAEASKKNAEPLVLRHGSYGALYDLPLYINWGITNMCNYNCSYCFAHDKIDKKKFIPFSGMLNALNTIANFNRPMYEFVFGGGEPTIYPNFIELINVISILFKNRINRILIISNGSREINFYTNLKEFAESIPIEVMISLHTEHVNPEHIYQLVESVSSCIRLHFSLMYNPAKLELIKDMTNKLCELRKKYNFSLSITLLREPPKFSTLDSKYTPEMYKWRSDAQASFNKIASENHIKTNVKIPVYSVYQDIFTSYIKEGRREIIGSRDRNWLFQNGYLNFKDMYCIGGTHMLRIEPSGTLRGIVCDAGKKLGNIYDSAFVASNDIFEIIKCPYPNCGCSANDPLMKFRDQHEADKYMHAVKEKQRRLFSDEC